MQNKVIFIVGPTGVGKTELAFRLAKKFDGNLISADSVQVYKELNIISGKDIPKDTQFIILPELSKNVSHAGYYNYNSIPIFLLDVVDSSFSFTVSHFQDLAKKVINFILRKKKLPIVVGGTGLYIKSLTSDIETVLISPNKKLRKELESLGIEELQEKLKSINKDKFESLNHSDLFNKRRLMRAIEASRIMNHESRIMKEKKYDSLTIGLYCDRDVLKQRIDKRVDARLKTGALDEAKSLFKNYENLSRQVKDANGYKQLFMFLNDEISLDEAVYRWKISEYRHAKNQMTWFKKYGDVRWFDITEKGFDKNIENSLREFLR